MAATPKRRWYQFSLRGMLALTTLICVGLGWLLHERNEVAKRAATIAVIQKLGGEVTFDEAKPFRPIWLRPVLGDKSPGEVVRVRFLGAKVTDADLAKVAGLAELQSLAFEGTPQLTDQGMMHLTRLSKLQRLSLRGTGVTDAGLANLSGLTELQHLSLGGTRVTDSGLVHLTSLKRLAWLWLDKTQVTDAGLDRLTNLTDLEVLVLDETRVTDAGLIRLAGFTKLKWLNLDRTRVSDQGVRDLQKALPGARIVL